ncbi:MAG: GDYXXLXY domain-containing protein [Candidatus Omnitrophica bacterium]|nr:GDYXXLXY domain-containing protein [Candidatus Omnitrophota bacterium]
MKSKLIIGLFLLLALVQIYVPFSMITKREDVLKHGEQFKFKTAPVDPYDAFRGRYVALRIENDHVIKQGVQDFDNGRSVYAIIDLDDQGFAGFSDLTLSRPIGKAYIKAKTGYPSGSKIYLDLPFDRYYMEEKAAPAAEAAYRKHSQQGEQDAYIVVRVKDGFAVIEGLYVAGQRIEDLVKQENRK